MQDCQQHQSISDLKVEEHIIDHQPAASESKMIQGHLVLT